MVVTNIIINKRMIRVSATKVVPVQVVHVTHAPVVVKSRSSCNDKKHMVLKMIHDINHDIIRMYEELRPLDTGVDIDMTCYLDPISNKVVCERNPCMS